MNPHCGSLPCGPVQKKLQLWCMSTWCSAEPSNRFGAPPCDAVQCWTNWFTTMRCRSEEEKKLSFRWTTILCSAKKATQCGSAQCGAVVNNPIIVVYFHVVHYHIVQCCTTLPLLYRAVQWDTVECVFCMNSQLQWEVIIMTFLSLNGSVRKGLWLT